MVTGLGKQKVILGFTWLNKHNPDINWKTRRIDWKRCDSERVKRIIKKSRKNHKMVNKTIKKKTPKTSIIEEDDEEERKNRTLNPIKDENETEIMLKLLDTITVRPEGWEKMTLLRHNYISFLCKIQPQTSIITTTNSGK